MKKAKIIMIPVIQPTQPGLLFPFWLAKGIQDIRSVADQPADFGIGACRIDCGERVARRLTDLAESRP
jgi:hypothetical protein